MNIANIKLPIAVIGIIVAQAFGIIWYVAQLDSTVKSNTVAIESMEVFDDTDLLKAIEDFDNRLDEIEKQQAIIENEMRTIMSDHSSFNDILKFILEIDNKVSRVVIVGHNPALTDIANYFSENKILNLPTSRWVKLIFNTDNWSTINNRDIQISLNNIKSEK